MTPDEVEGRLLSDLEFFAAEAPLLIKGKVAGLAVDEDEDRGVGAGAAGSLIPWRFNNAQRHMQRMAEIQRKRTGGWVRMLLEKGRQQGGSTWAGGRFYHKTRSIPGTSTAIISHDGKSTTKLFKMVERFHSHVQECFRPEVGKANANQLTFPRLNSDYSVYTAGSEDAGRSGTAQLLHGSEVAYWPNDYAIQDSALESIAFMAGTEIVLESTGNGPKGLFYDKCMLALRKRHDLTCTTEDRRRGVCACPGGGDYILVFVPWYWQEEYERDVPVDFALDAEEQEYVARHFPASSPLTPPPLRVLRKMAWRRAKILDLSTANGGINTAAGHAKFQRIYPSLPLEAFQASGLGVIRADAIISARKNFTLTDDDAPLVMGVDPAGDSESSDRTVIAFRRGRVMQEVITYDRMKPMRLAGIIDKFIVGRDVRMVFVDNGYGAGTVDRLHEMGHRENVQGVWFNEGTLYPEKYRNKRSEIILEFAKWVNDGDVRLPDDDDVHADLAAMPMNEETSDGIFYIKTKKEIKKILGRSPDIYDACALTFAYAVRRETGNGGAGTRFRKAPGSGMKSASLRRRGA